MKTNNELNTVELDAVSGGFRWWPTRNPDVIDARGGQITAAWFQATLDIKGNVSSFRVR